MRIFSDDIEALLTQLDSKGGGLRKRSDIGMLFELAASIFDSEGINAIIFNGKVIWNTYSILKRTSQDDDTFMPLEKEFMDAVHTLRNQLFDYSEHLTEADKTRIDETYLGMTQGTIRNIVDLAHDLAEIKNLQNDAKYSQ